MSLTRPERIRVIDEELLVRVADAADSIERAGTIPAPLIDELKAAQCFSLLLPARLGGHQMSYPDYLEVIQALAHADGSVGWCANQGSVLATLANQLPEAAAREIWPRADCSIANGPPGRCEAGAAEGGYRLSGTWSFSSGIEHATYLAGVAPLRENGRTTRALWCFFPKADAVIDRQWNVHGLKGTASYAFSVNDLTIPEHMAISYTLPDDGPALYRIPMNLLFACGFAAVALGVARGALDFAIDRTREKVKRFDKRTLDKSEGTQSQVGRAETLWQAANLFLHTSTRRVWDDLEKGSPLTDEHRIVFRMAGTHVIRQAMDVTDIAYAMCSTDSIFTDNDIQRRFQDMHVITQHLQGRTEIYALLGRYFLDLPFEHPLLG